MVRKQTGTGTEHQHERVFCPCCKRMVSPNTRTNHLTGRRGGPAVRAAALSYRQQVMSAAPPIATTNEDAGNTELIEEDIPGQGDHWQHVGKCSTHKQLQYVTHYSTTASIDDDTAMDLPSIPSEAGPSRTLHSTAPEDNPLAHLVHAIHNLRSRAKNSVSRETEGGEDDGERDGESEDGHGDGEDGEMSVDLASPQKEAEDQSNEPDEAEELDENGLFVHQRLTETFERELVEACECKMYQITSVLLY